MQLRGNEAINAFHRIVDALLSRSRPCGPSGNAMSMTKVSRNSPAAAGSGALPNSQLPSGV